MKVIGWSIGVILASLALLLAWCEYTENPKSYFATYVDAKNSGIMDRGWIPSFIPRSSREIREKHNLDTNTVEMLFKYSPGDTQEVEKNCPKKETTSRGTKWYCEYFESKVTMELNSDGTARLSSHRK